MQDIKSHRRVNDILLGPLERPALQWFAARMPAWVTPDILTGFGTFGAILVFTGYVLSNVDKNYLWLASLGFLINWFGDSLDGTLARYRNAQRPKYGFFIDHTVDAINEVFVFLGVGLSPYVQFEIASLALIGYLLMSVLIYIRTCVSGVFKISYARIGPTEIRAIAILANTLVFFSGNMLLNLRVASLGVFDLVGIIIALGLFVAFLISTFTQAREISQYD